MVMPVANGSTWHLIFCMPAPTRLTHQLECAVTCEIQRVGGHVIGQLHDQRRSSSLNANAECGLSLSLCRCLCLCLCLWLWLWLWLWLCL